MLPLSEIKSEHIEATKAEFDLQGIYPLIPAPKISPVKKLLREFDPYSTDTHGQTLSEADLIAINKQIESHDIIWIHGIRIANCLNIKKLNKVVLDIDDIPSQFEKSKSHNAANIIEKVVALKREFSWKLRESVLIKRFGTICVCSEPDNIYLGEHKTISVIPNGFQITRKDTAAPKPHVARIGFIGTLHYQPNVIGIQWFIAKVWPKILEKRPDATLRLVGSDTEAETCEKTNINGLGWVSDAEEEMSTWNLTVVPIHTGGGTRIKIAEAFALKCPTVSTSLGAFGYDIENRKEIMLADSPDDFADACLEIIENPDLANSLAQNAWKRFEKEWSWEAISDKVKDAFDSHLKNNY